VTFSTAGDGLVRPLNAPSGQQVQPGVQPGVSGGVVLASYVIVFGQATGGAGPGIFIYSGSPGPGNPPVFSMSNATQDPYGNAIAPGIWSGQFGGTQAGLQVNGPLLGELAFPVAGSSATGTASIVGASVGTGGSVMQIASAIDPAPDNDRVFMQLADHAAIGSSAVWFLVYQDANGTEWVQATGGNAGMALNSVSGLTGVLPGTGTSITNAAQPETWHNLTLDAGWTVVNQPQYRLLPGVGVQVRGLITIAATSLQTNINGGVPIPSAYWPAVTRYYRTPMPAPDLAGSVDIQSNGVFVMRASGFAAVQAILDGIYSL
jgi:hypothetical protein